MNDKKNDVATATDLPKENISPNATKKNVATKTAKKTNPVKSTSKTNSSNPKTAKAEKPKAPLKTSKKQPPNDKTASEPKEALQRDRAKSSPANTPTKSIANKRRDISPRKLATKEALPNDSIANSAQSPQDNPEKFTKNSPKAHSPKKNRSRQC